MILKYKEMIVVSDYNAIERSALLKWLEKNAEVNNPEYQQFLRFGGGFPPKGMAKKIRLYSEVGKEFHIATGLLYKLMNDFGFTSVGDYTVKQDDIGWDADDMYDELYDYQKKAVDHMLKEQFGGIVVSPAGSGKTQMAICLLAKLNKSTLWIVHTGDLVAQSKARYMKYFGDEGVGEISEGRCIIGEKVTFATIQTLCKLDLDKLKNQWQTIIVDECHRACGGVNACKMYYKVLTRLNAQYKIGITATLHRADGLEQTTIALLGEEKYRIMKTQIQNKLIPVTYYMVRTKIGVSSVCYKYDGTLVFARAVNEICDNPDRNNLIVNDTISLSEEGHNILLLTDRVEHTQVLADMISARTDRPVYIVTGKTAVSRRDFALDKMRTKGGIMIATFALAKEGLDIPCLSALQLCTPHKDSTVIIQSVGRVERTCADKTKAIVLDYVDDTRTFAAQAVKRRRVMKREKAKVVECAIGDWKNE